MSVMWNVCAWTGLIWWGCVLVALPVIIIPLYRGHFDNLEE